MKLGSVFFCMVVSIKVFGQTSTVVGSGAGGSAGINNSSFGYNAGRVISSSGVANTFVGESAGYSFTSGGDNTFVGAGAGYGNISASNNTFLGRSSGRFSTSGDNTFVGSGSGLFNNSGTSNTFIGLNSGYGNYSGSNNVALGANSYYSCVNGSQNVLIGDGAGYHLTGSGNVCIGYQAGYGYDANGSNKLYIANSATPTPLIYGDFSTNQLVINGSLGVGVTLANNPNGYKFAVNGKIGAKEVQIENTSTTWPDYVFKNDFKLRSLADVESFIKANGHLPEIPSEKQVKQEGIKVGEMNAKLLQKIEELTLYLIEANKRIDDLSKEVKELQSKK